MPFPPLLPTGPALVPCLSIHLYTSAPMCPAKEDHTTQHHYLCRQCFSQWEGPRVAARPCGLQGWMAQHGEQEEGKKGESLSPFVQKPGPKFPCTVEMSCFSSQSHLDWQECSSSCHHVTSTVHMCCDFSRPLIFCASFLLLCHKLCQLFTLTQGYGNLSHASCGFCPATSGTF